MANTINDYIFELQWNGNKVTKGIDAIEARLNRLANKSIKINTIQQRATANRIVQQQQQARFTPYDAKGVFKQAQLEDDLNNKRLVKLDQVNARMEKMNNFLRTSGNVGGARGEFISANASEALNKWQAFQDKWHSGTVRTKKQLNEMHNELLAINAETRILSTNARVAASKFSLLNNITKRVGATFLAMGASSMGAYALAGGAAASFNAAKEYEKLDIAMTAAFGSQQAANREMEYAESVSKKYALDIMAVGEGWSKISYAAKMSNMPIDQARQMFEDLAVSSRAFGLSADDTKGAMRAVIQMMGKGKVNAEDLRQQLAERIPAAIPMLAKSMGITIGELEDQMKKGAIPAEKLVGMFQLMAEDVKGSGALTKSLQSMGAAQTALANSMKKASKQFWGDGMRGGFKDFMFMLTDFLEKNSNGIAQWGNTFSIAGRIVLDTLGAISPILSLVNAGFAELAQLTMSGSVSKTQFGQLNALGKLLAAISWVIHDIKLAYTDLQKLITGEEITGGQKRFADSNKMSMGLGIPIEDQIAWETKHGKSFQSVLSKLSTNEMSIPSEYKNNTQGAYSWIKSQAEKMTAMQQALGGATADQAAIAGTSNMYRLGEKMVSNLSRGTLEFKIDASQVVNLNKDGTANVAVPYTFQLPFVDAGGKSRN